MNAALLGFIGSIIVAIISLIGVIITNSTSNKKLEQQILTAQAVTDTKLENLTIEVNKHNNFAGRIPVIEKEIEVINHRLKNLEEK